MKSLIFCDIANLILESLIILILQLPIIYLNNYQFLMKIDCFNCLICIMVQSWFPVFLKAKPNLHIIFIDINFTFMLGIYNYLYTFLDV